MRSVSLRECLCSEFSLAQQKRTKEGLGPVLAGQRGSAHRTDMKMSGFIRQHRGKRDEEDENAKHSHYHRHTLGHRFRTESDLKTRVEKSPKAPLSSKRVRCSLFFSRAVPSSIP